MDLFQKITQDTLLLTPNRRLTAHYLNQHHQFQIKQKKTHWHSLDILPFNSWLERTWKEYLSNDIENSLLLMTPNQELILWEKIISQSELSQHLLRVSETAELAKSAWGLLKQWKIHLNNTHLQLTEDSTTFLSWAQQFAELCQKHDWIDQNSLTDLIVEKIQSKLITIPKHIIMIGFTEFSPQHNALLKSYQDAGTLIEYHQQQRFNNNVSYISLKDKEDEIRTMARWSKQLYIQNNKLQIGCIIPNLEDHRATVSRIFTEVFSEPGLYSSNLLSLPFNISAGRSLASYPVIHTALEILTLRADKLTLDNISYLLHSPFVGDAEKEMLQRAEVDVQFRQDNQIQISLQNLLMKHNKIPLFIKRIQSFFNKVPPHTSYYKANAWVNIFIELLTNLGWPGERSVNSEEYQTIQRWMELFNEFKSLDYVTDEFTYATALHYLKRLTAITVFQPQSPTTPIQILGILEAAEIPFDYLWVMGLDDMTWPPAPKPNPFIPQQLQKSLHMPHATAERELLFCKKMTDQLKNGADFVIFSHPLQRDDADIRPSSLLNPFPEILLNQLKLSLDNNIMLQSFTHKKIESYLDYLAPPILNPEEIRGGAKIFELQAACPFKAFAELRLYAKPFEPTSLGLRAFDRGNVVHKALEIIWQELKNLQRLQAIDSEELDNLIKNALTKALSQINNDIIKKIKYRELELQRLHKIILNWLQIEKTRPPFTILSQEQQYKIIIANIPVSLRIDRIDELENQQKLIIDYKTGKYHSVNDWFGERPDSPQLPLYCLLDSENTVGIAFAVIHAEKMGFKGTSKYDLNINSINPLIEQKNRHANDWHDQLLSWRNILEKLGKDFCEGHAEVNPKDALQTCEHCNLKSFCRIYEKI